MPCWAGMILMHLVEMKTVKNNMLFISHRPLRNHTVWFFLKYFDKEATDNWLNEGENVTHSDAFILIIKLHNENENDPCFRGDKHQQVILSERSLSITIAMIVNEKTF